MHNTIGFLLEALNNKYSNQMLQGVLDASRELGYNVVRFILHRYYLSQENHEFHMEMIYKTIEKCTLDGLLFLGWWQGFDTEQQNISFKKRFSGLQLLSLGKPLYGIPSVYMNGGYYLTKLIKHLIEIHHYKRIVCIPPGVPDSRITIFRNIMKEYGLYSPDFDINSGELENSYLIKSEQRVSRILQMLLDERKLSIEAIISLNAGEAAEFVHQLHQRGLRVPDDIAVTSYEDGETARFIDPPLTTIYYPFYEIGYEGTKKLINILRLQPVPLESTVKSRLIFRKSCGCKIPMNDSCGESAARIINDNIFELSDYEKEQLINHLCQKTNLPQISDFLELLLSGLKCGNSIVFIRTFESYLQNSTKTVDDVQAISQHFYIFKSIILPYFSNNYEALEKIETTWFQLQLLVQERIKYLMGIEHLLLNERDTLFNEISQNVIITFTLDKVLDVFTRNLKTLQIPNCFLFLYTDPGYKNYDLALAYKDHQRIKAEDIDPSCWKKAISASMLANDTTHTLLLNHLHINEEYIGFIIYEPGSVDERLYYTLSVHLSTALKGALLVEKYQDINLELQSTQKQMVDNAFRAGMANIALGTLHNAGNILNSLEISIAVLRRITNKLSDTGLQQIVNMVNEIMKKPETASAQNPEDGPVIRRTASLENDIESIKHQLFRNIKRSKEKIELMTNLVVSQQKYVGIKEIKERVNVMDVIDDAVSILETDLKANTIEIDRKSNADFIINIDKTKLIHILINLITNAIEAIKETAELYGKITISAEKENTCFYIRLEDTGCGIESGVKKNLFRMGFSTKKAGRGFGLHTCANYMMEMGGRIAAESAGINKGSVFILQFPLDGSQETIPAQ